MAIPGRVRVVLAARGLSQAYLARDLRVSPTTVSRLLSGGRLPWPAQATHIADALLLPESDLFGSERRTRKWSTREPRICRDCRESFLPLGPGQRRCDGCRARRAR